MESMETLALKSSLLSELSMKPNQNNQKDDLPQVCVSNGDDFSVDAFLDLSNNDSQAELSEERSESVTCCQPAGITNNDGNNMFFDSLDSSFFPNEYKYQKDDFDNLEWLAKFVEDSDSEFTTGVLSCKPTAIKPTIIQKKPMLIQKKSYPVSCSNLSLPMIQKDLGKVKTRSKRGRSCGTTWSSSSSSSNQDLMELIPEAEQKKVCKLSEETENETVGLTQILRRCSHCQVQKTPQWRRGPFGPKTLCNACGVRFKSGRLFPEYRPACSPTFSGEIHSNSHRKVLELRKNTYDGLGTSSSPNASNFY
ncbi:GATA transcription factor 7-like [Impatiens glandulifera]|uniref:GATA transcription factor 7-like n=1 Tax=Impatiens glandulifera TaxID=253017 RepID=UPI001FB07A89|nr:GATA transcription factor 7-like [Impatiens glandulifera]